MTKLLNMRKTSLAILVAIFFLIIIAANWLLPERAKGAGTTYYMARGGLASKAAATIDCTVANAMSVTAHNSALFSPDDVIVLCDDGGSFDSQITIPSSGAGATDLITYQAEAGGSPVIDLNNAADYCFRGIDKQFISISGVTCQEANESGIRFSDETNDTSSLTTITISNITCNNVMQHCVWITGLDSSDLYHDIDVGNSTFNRWSQETTAGSGADKTSNEQTAAVKVSYADDVLINKNKLDTLSCPRVGGSGCGNGIIVVETTNDIIEYNEITTKIPTNQYSGHGIYVKCVNSATSCTGTGNIIRYNYLHDLGDDCFWMDNQTDNPLYYGNLCINTNDDCTDIRGTNVITGTGKVYNNTCVNYASVGIQTGNLVANEYKNNVYVAPITGTTFPYFVNFEDGEGTGSAVIDNSTFNNNIYYNSNGTGDLEAFVSYDMTTGTSGYNGEIFTGKSSTFANWKLDNSAPDANSSIVNPNLNLVTGDCTLDTAMPITGIDQSATFTQLLKRGATWSVGVAPDLTGVHSPYPVGAYAISGICADGFIMQGVTLDGVTVN